MSNEVKSRRRKRSERKESKEWNVRGEDKLVEANRMKRNGRKMRRSEVK